MHNHAHDIMSYNATARQLRRFFQDKKGFIEVPSFARTSILAACEDPKTITKFSLGGVTYPLPQTGQMWLEYELLKNPGIPGVFCLGPSYRDEPNPIPGRHTRLLALFEFESHGTIDDLRTLERELLLFLGLEDPHIVLYEDLCSLYKTNLLEAADETRMGNEIGNVISLEKFPRHSSPFWNMKRNNENLYNKIDVILFGMETIGSAERSCNVDEMREDFLTISEGQYAQLLFSQFGQDRVLKELDEFLALPFFPRFGGGIGMMRLERALRAANITPSIHSMPVQEHFVGPRRQGFQQSQNY